jgi:DNA-binding IscR family transcriptional regulator
VITIASILATVDDVSRREESPNTAGGQMWVRLSNRIYDYLDSITLDDAVESLADDAQESLFGSDFRQTAA